jgi:hypothetical protein
MPRRSLVHQAVPLVTTLPASPVDGQIVDFLAIYNAGSDAVTWRLRYRASSGYTYKWEVVGGAPMTNGPSTTLTNVTTAADQLWVDGPASLTVPASGDYVVEHGANMFHVAAGAWHAYCGMARNNVNFGIGVDSCSSGQYDAMTGSIMNRATLAKNDVLSLHVSLQSALQTQFNSGWMKLTPVRVG